MDHGPSPARGHDETERLIQALEQAAVALSHAPLSVQRAAHNEWRNAKAALEALIGRLERVRRTLEQQSSRHRPTTSAARGLVVELVRIWCEWRRADRRPLPKREWRRQAQTFVLTCLDVLGLNLSFRSLCAIVRRVID
jgi:hypothetical protein